MRLRLTVILLTLLIAGCYKFNPRSRDDKDSGGEKEVGPDANGVVSSKYDAQQKSAFEVTAKDAGAISGAGISIPPGALSIDTNVSLQEGGSLVSDASAANLGIDGGGVSAAGPAVLFGADDPSATLSGNVSITLPLSDQAALNLAACANYAVFYRIKDAAGAVTSGAYASSALSVKETSITFDSTGFGVFQAACTGKAIEVTVAKPSQEPIISKRDENALTPVAFTVSKPVYAAATRSYDVVVSATGFQGDAKCYATIDQDKLAPSDKVVGFVVGKGISVAALRDAAHTVYLRASCYEANGRSSKSDWSSAMAFAAKGTGTGTGTGTGSETPVVPTATFTSPLANTWINASSDAAHLILTGTCSPVGQSLDITTPGNTTLTTTCGTNLLWSKEVNASGPDLNPVVFSVKPTGVTSGAATLSLKRDTNAPSAPTNLTRGALAITFDSTPDFSWDAVADAVKYDIHYGTTTGGDDLALVPNLTVTTHTYAAAASDGSRVFARVRAYDAAGNASGWSSEVSLQFDLSSPTITGTIAPSPSKKGAIDVTFTLVADVVGYDEVRIVRVPGLTAPDDCNSGVEMLPVVSSPNSGTQVKTDIVGGMTRVGKYSYTLCVKDFLARTSIFKIQTGSAVLPSENPGPSCLRPPCDPARSTTAPGGMPNSVNDLMPGVNFTSVALGDLDNDGDLDVVAGAASGQPVTIFPNLKFPSNTFSFGSPELVVATNISAPRLLLADFNSDDDLDLVVNGMLFLGSSGRTFVATPITEPADCIGAIAAGDIDGDGWLDLVCGARTYYRGLNTGHFQAAVLLGSASAPDDSPSRDVAIGDLNNDRRLDIIFSKDGGGTGEMSTVYVNPGGNLAGLASAPLADIPYNTKGVKLAYLNAGNDLDVVMFDGASQNHLLGSANGTFGFAPTSGTGLFQTEWGVLANLGDDDAHLSLVTFSAGGIDVSTWNTGFGASTHASSSDIAGTGWGGDVGDLDGDGKLDFVGAYYSPTDKLSYYLSQ